MFIRRKRQKGIVNVGPTITVDEANEQIERAIARTRAKADKATKAALRQLSEQHARKQLAECERAEREFVAHAINFVQNFVVPLMARQKNVEDGEIWWWLNEFQLRFRDVRSRAEIATQEKYLDSELFALARGEKGETK